MWFDVYFETAIEETVCWYRKFGDGKEEKRETTREIGEFTRGQIDKFCADAARKGLAWAGA